MIRKQWDRSKPPRGGWEFNKDSPQAEGLVAWVPGWPQLEERSTFRGSTISALGAFTYMVDTQFGIPAPVFNGSTTKVSIGNIGFLSAFTLVCTARLNATLGYQSLISRGGVFENNTNYVLGFRSDTSSPRIFLYARNSGTLVGMETTALSGAVAVAAAPFFRIAATYANGAQAIWVAGLDGIPVSMGVGSGSNTSALGTDGSQSTIFGAPNTTTSSDAYFDNAAYDLRVYDRVLSDPEIYALFDYGQRFDLWRPAQSARRAIGVATAATAYDVVMPTPASGFAGNQTDFITLVANGALTADAHVTVTSSDGGDTFQSSPVTIAQSTGQGQFKFTPDSTVGARTLHFTNDGGLTDPADQTYTANAPPTGGRLGSLFEGSLFR